MIKDNKKFNFIPFIATRTSGKFVRLRSFGFFFSKEAAMDIDSESRYIVNYDKKNKAISFSKSPNGNKLSKVINGRFYLSAKGLSKFLPLGRYWAICGNTFIFGQKPKAEV